MDQTEVKRASASENLAKKFKICKFVTLSVLVVFLLGGLVLFKNDITIENLRYLIKYLDFSSDGEFNEETRIHYSSDSGNQFQVFRGDFALISDSGVTLYDRRGSAVMTDSYQMTNPVSVCGDRYLAIFDLGGHQVRIYNSFSLLFEESFEYPVQSVSINSEGSFCVASSEKSFHSAIYVYNRDFEEIRRWSSADKFVTEVHLSDQDILTLSTIRADSGSLIGEMTAFRLGDEEPLYNYSYEDQLPLAFSAHGEDVLLLTDENIMNIEKGKEVKREYFPDDSLKQVRVGKELCLLVQDELSVGVNFKVRLFDRGGNEVTSANFSVQIRDVEVYEDRAYILTHTHLYVLFSDGSLTEYELDGDYTDFGVLSEDVVILCSDVFAQIRILDKEGADT